MKYSYSPSAGFSSTPVHTRAISLNVAPPTSQYASPTAQSPSPLSPPSSSSSSFYGNFAGSQSQPTPPPSYAPQLPPRSPEHDRKTSTGYIPVSYDSYGGGVTPEQFYGSLIDTSGRPTAIFSRVADAFFFWLDQSCDIHGLRGTGMIEPAKYGWMMGKLGSTPEACRMIQPYMLSFYTTTGIPFRYIQTPQGQVPVVDRRGWLHMVVFEAKATPQESYQHWAKSLTLLPLVDPATGKPFPTPFPRSALPAIADPGLNATYMTWQTQTVASVTRARSEAIVQNIMGSAGPSYNFNPYSGFNAASMGAGTGAFGAASGGGGGGGGGGSGSNSGSGGGDSGGGGDSHSTVLDTVNSVATLANTVIGAFSGNSGGGGNGGGNNGNGLGGAAALGALGGTAFNGGYGTGFGGTTYGF